MQINSISFKAKLVNNPRHKNACECAYLRYMEDRIAKGESLLASSVFPEHKLKLLKDGIQNITTKKTQTFPWQFAENMTPTENLLNFYKYLSDSNNQFMKELFKL